MGIGDVLFRGVIELWTVDDMREGGREGSKTRKKMVTSFMNDPKQLSHDVDALRNASVEFLNE